MRKPGKLLLSWLLDFLLCLPGFNQVPLFHGDVRSQGMSGAHAILANEWSMLNNAAGLAYLNGKSLSISYENFFQVPELGSAGFSFAAKAGKIGYGCCYTSLGYSLFRQHHITAGLGMPVTPQLTTGIAFHYLLIKQPGDYGNLYAIVPSIGIQWVTGKILIGLSAFNPASQKYGKSDTQVESNFALGVGIRFGENFLWGIETEKKTAANLIFVTGFEAAIKKRFYTRFGISSRIIQQYSLGLGFKSDHLIIDVAVTSHPVLEYNSAVSFSIMLDKGRGKKSFSQ